MADGIDMPSDDRKVERDEEPPATAAMCSFALAIRPSETMPRTIPVSRAPKTTFRPSMLAIPTRAKQRTSVGAAAEDSWRDRFSHSRSRGRTKSTAAKNYDRDGERR